MGEASGFAGIALDMLRAPRQGPAGLARRQEARLAALVRHARARSPWYRLAYRHLPGDGVALADLPPVSKPELMAAFDDWVTDPAVTREGLERFMSDPARVGAPFLGRYFVCSTSGTTGSPGLFVHDRHAVAVYRAFTYRLDLAWFSADEWLRLARGRVRWASVVGTGGHYAGEGWMESERRRSRWRRHSYRVLSVQQPLAGLVAALNDFEPAILTGYPSALELLAAEQRAGALRLRPVVVELAGESMSGEARARVAAAFRAPVHDAYAASECLTMAFDCEHGWLHVNSDWLILEPVDADHRPTPPGEPSHTVLLTNLANRVQPIIRYDLGDSVLARPATCPCGSPLPAIRVAGRRDDVLRLAAPGGRPVAVLPLAIGSVVEETPGVRRFQLVQTGPAALRLRLEPAAGADVEAMWRDARAGLTAYLRSQGLADVEVVRASEPPEPSASSGKFRQVVGRPW